MKYILAPLVSISLFFGFYSSFSQNTISFNSTDNWMGYMNVFDMNGGFQFGSNWAVQELKTTIDQNANTITLQPNFNAYADNPGDPYWQNGAIGAKIMEASTLVEPGASFNGNDLTFSGEVVSNTLDNTLYNAKFFIKALDPSNGYADALSGSAVQDLPLNGIFSISVPASSLSAGLIVQYGFMVNGINANPADESVLGSIVISGPTSPPTNFNQLVWSDEFDVDGPVDPSKWYHQTLLPNGVSWFNGEQQHYTNRIENSYVDGGNLYIVAKKENFTDQGQTKQYTSARLNSKFAFTHGRVEVRAKLPDGIGTWPAIWMLGKNINENGAYWYNQGFGSTNWPDCGEIDIMEHWGNNQNYIQSALHTPSSFGATINHGGLMASDVSNTFHTYAMEWTEDKITFSLDSLVFYTYSPSSQNMSNWPFIDDQYILLNIAIEPSIDPNFTQSPMVIDYVRIYQQGSATGAIQEAPSNLKVYPNPSEDIIRIKNFENQQNLSVHLYDLDGQLLLSTTQPELSMRPFSKGTYIVKVSSAFSSEEFKVVKR